MPNSIDISRLKQKCKKYLEENPMLLTKAEKERLVQELNALSRGEHQPTYHLCDLVYFSCELDLYEEFANLVSKKVSLRGLRILDVGAGRHIRSSIELKKKGAKVDAMDNEARSRNGIRAIKEKFQKETDVSKYDVIVGLQLPKQCIEDIVKSAASANKKYILIPSGNTFQDEWEILKFLGSNSGAKRERWEVDGIIHFNVITNL